jgi:hypothetical protein
MADGLCSSCGARLRFDAREVCDVCKAPIHTSREQPAQWWWPIVGYGFAASVVGIGCVMVNVGAHLPVDVHYSYWRGRYWLSGGAWLMILGAALVLVGIGAAFNTTKAVVRGRD